MKKEEILNLIGGGETQEAEFKEGCPANHEISQIICAFVLYGYDEYMEVVNGFASF